MLKELIKKELLNIADDVDKFSIENTHKRLWGLCSKIRRLDSTKEERKQRAIMMNKKRWGDKEIKLAKVNNIIIKNK